MMSLNLMCVYKISIGYDVLTCWCWWVWDCPPRIPSPGCSCPLLHSWEHTGGCSPRPPSSRWWWACHVTITISSSPSSQYVPTVEFQSRHSWEWQTCPLLPGCPHCSSRRWCWEELQVEPDKDAIHSSSLMCLDVHLSPILSMVKRGKGEERG